MQERINELVEILNEANYNYYVLDKSIITDQEFDKYLRELMELEMEYPDLKSGNSPTQRVGGEVIDGFLKVRHRIPMLSIGDVFNEDEIREFDERIKKEGFAPEFVCELKIDGLSVSLYYEKGKLVRAATRGNGVEGDDITNNVKTIKTIPIKLKEKIDIEVRGEIYMKKSTFEKINSGTASSALTVSSYFTEQEKKYCCIGLYCDSQQEYELAVKERNRRYSKQKYIKQLEKKGIKRSIGELGQLQKENKEQCKALLVENPGMSSKEFFERTGLSKTTYNRYKSELGNTKEKSLQQQRDYYLQPFVDNPGISCNEYIQQLQCSKSTFRKYRQIYNKKLR